MTKPKLDYTKILPVLFLEYLVVSLARSLVPSMIVDSFGAYSYLAVGVMETLKGLLAFVSSPLFGKLSDKIGMNIMHGKRGSWYADTIMIFRSEVLLVGDCSGHNSSSVPSGLHTQYVRLWSSSQYIRFLLCHVRFDVCIHIGLCGCKAPSPRVRLGPCDFRSVLHRGTHCGRLHCHELRGAHGLCSSANTSCSQRAVYRIQAPRNSQVGQCKTSPASGVECNDSTTCATLFVGYYCSRSSSHTRSLAWQWSTSRTVGSLPRPSKYSGMVTRNLHMFSRKHLVASRGGLVCNYRSQLTGFNCFSLGNSADPFMWNLATIVFIYYTAVVSILSCMIFERTVVQSQSVQRIVLNRFSFAMYLTSAHVTPTTVGHS
jgi:hypothetical protein